MPITPFFGFKLVDPNNGNFIPIKKTSLGEIEDQNMCISSQDPQYQQFVTGGKQGSGFRKSK
jgi:hypothetical protein